MYKVRLPVCREEQVTFSAISVALRCLRKSKYIFKLNTDSWINIEGIAMNVVVNYPQRTRRMR